MKKQLFMTILMGIMATTLLTGCGGETDSSIDNKVDLESGVIDELEDEIIAPELRDTYDFAINGKVYNLPLTCGELFGEGSEVYYDGLPEDYQSEYWNDVDMYSTTSDLYIGKAYTYFDQDLKDTHDYAEEYVYWLSVEADDVRVSGTDFVIYGGITFDSTPEDLKAVFGEPDRFGEGDNEFYSWENLDPGNPYTMNNEYTFYFEDGVMYKMVLKHTTDESMFH